MLDRGLNLYQNMPLRPLRVSCGVSGTRAFHSGSSGSCMLGGWIRPAPASLTDALSEFGGAVNTFLVLLDLLLSVCGESGHIVPLGPVL